METVSGSVAAPTGVERDISPVQETIAADTAIQYMKKYEQLKARARNALGSKFAIATLATYAIETVRPGLSPDSWYFYRRALVYGLGEEAKALPGRAGAIAVAMEQLQRTRPSERVGTDEILKTSRRKSKRLMRDDLDRICERARNARTPNGPPLADMLEAGYAAGLRPCEWRQAELTELEDPEFRWQLRVRNAKRGTFRAHGEFRTLRWRDLDPDVLGAMTRTIALARSAAAARRSATLQNTLEALMRRIAESLFPRRRRRPTLYTARHAFCARCKQHFVPAHASLSERVEGLVQIAALMGHATDATASHHYARPETGARAGGIPIPDPSEVARVRRVYAPRFERLLDNNSKSPQP